MDATFIRHRISELRTKKGVSEYKMSADLGHSKSYIQSISSGKALPSMGEFLYICEYLGVTPKEFFDTDNAEPQLVAQLSRLAQKLPADDVEAYYKAYVCIWAGKNGSGDTRYMWTSVERAT